MKRTRDRMMMLLALHSIWPFLQVRLREEMKTIGSWSQYFDDLRFLIGEKSIVALLVENGADVHARNKNGQTPCDVVYESSKMRKY